MLSTDLTPQVCERGIRIMNPAIREKIARAFIDAIDSGADLLAADGTSPAGEQVMAGFNAEMSRRGWADETRKMFRFNIRVIGMTLIREAFTITRS